MHWLTRRLGVLHHGAARLGAPFLLVAGLLAVALSTAPPVGAVPPTVSSPRTDGTTIAWIEYYYYPTLYVQTIGAQQPQTVASYVDHPDVSGDRLVWEALDEPVPPGGVAGPTRLGGVNLATGTPLTLPNTTGEQLEPSLSGNWLVWVNHDPSDLLAPWAVLATDLSTSFSPLVLGTFPSSVTSVGRPEISGSHVLWSVGTDLWLADLNGGTPATIAGAAGRYQDGGGYDIGGQAVVYAANSQVHLIDLANPTADRVLSGHGTTPTTDGRYVFWEDTQLNSAGLQQRSVVAYDIASDSFFAAAVNANEFNWAPRTRGGVLVWMQTLPYSYGGIPQARPIHDLLPSAPLPNPGTSDPNWTYYPPTGHYLGAGFRSFWQQSGGLPVFGYPLTEEFTQGGYTVQYVERQRFEYHPEFKGTPYEVELGRLGAADAAQRSLDRTQPFQPLPPGTPSNANCVFVPATGHRLCGGFKAYWQSHGLDFGDPGVSYRESLALFGYPLSEEFTDPASGLTVQYFERAVFEYHPENPEPYKVELRLLGTRQLQAAGW